MSFNMTWVLADSSYRPAPGDLEKVIDYLLREQIIAEKIDSGSPVIGEEFHWKAGARASFAVEGEGYRPPCLEESQVTVCMNAQPAQIGDSIGPSHQTSFYILFYEGAEAADEFVTGLSNVLGTRMIAWIGYY